MTDTTLEAKAIDAMKAFPIPSINLNEKENYRRILDWLYSPINAAYLITELTEKKNDAT